MSYIDTVKTKCISKYYSKSNQTNGSVGTFNVLIPSKINIIRACITIFLAKAKKYIKSYNDNQ